jgi:hypothetical protein
MLNIPVPCTNCLRFHYGPCWEAPKQCFRCGGFNHIERYCRDRRIRTDRRGPLPGTLRWCEMHGLNDDPELKREILEALKTSPGCSIWVNDRCIHQGNERHFAQNGRGRRGRPLADRVTRARSKSPARERVWKRSRSPSRRPQSYFQSYDDSTDYARSLSPRPHDRYRSRTPIRRRSPSPYRSPPRRQERAPPYASGSNAVDVGPRSNKTRATSFHGGSLQPDVPLPPTPTHMPMLLATGGAKIQSSTGPATPLCVVSAQAPLGDLSANIPWSTVSAAAKPMSPTTLNNYAAAPTIPKPTAHKTAANTGVQRSQVPNQNEIFVEDPYFVLGVSQNATEFEYVAGCKTKD